MKIRIQNENDSKRYRLFVVVVGICINNMKQLSTFACLVSTFLYVNVFFFAGIWFLFPDREMNVILFFFSFLLVRPSTNFIKKV